MDTTIQAPHKIGQTKSVGFEFGLRRTFTIQLSRAWQFLTSEEGIRLWLGEVKGFRLEKGCAYQSTDGATGTVRVVNQGVNLRLTWQPLEWAKPSTIQVRVIPAGDKTTISFHQENLPDAESRELMRQRWESVMSKIEEALIH